MKSCEAVGKVSKLFGHGGELIINLYDNFPADIVLQEPLFVSIDSLAVPLFLEKFERRGVTNALAAFADMDTPLRAGELVGLELSMDLDDGDVADDDKGMYLDDMTGFEVRFTDSDAKGTIEEFIDNGMNPLFAVAIDGREVLIPAVDEFIASFSRRRRSVKFRLPQGLVDLQLRED